jgi:hypothetical protein
MKYGPVPPPTDPKAERMATETQAASDANAEIAANRQRRRQQSTLATGAAGVNA